MTCTYTRSKPSRGLTLDDFQQAVDIVEQLKTKPKIYFHVSPYHPSPGMVYVVKPPNLPFHFDGEEIESVAILHAADKRRFLRLCTEFGVEAIPLGPQEVT